MTATIERPPVPDAPAPVWRSDRRPLIGAVVVIVTVTLVGWGLRWWGPLNPEVSVAWVRTGDTDGNRGAPWGPTPALRIEVTNASHLPITVESVTLATPHTVTPALHQTTEVDSPTVDGQTSLELWAQTPQCDPAVTSFSLEATVVVRSAAGRTFSVTEPLPPAAAACRLVLPPAGEQPPDPESARAWVTQAFWYSHDGSLPVEPRLATIDDPRGVGETYELALTSPMGAVVPLVRADVWEVVFDRPDHAWVSYVLGWSAVNSPLQGEAVLVDGTWKVTRSTVCRDLHFAQVSCPD